MKPWAYKRKKKQNRWLCDSDRNIPALPYREKYSENNFYSSNRDRKRAFSALFMTMISSEGSRMLKILTELWVIPNTGKPFTIPYPILIHGCQIQQTKNSQTILYVIQNMSKKVLTGF